MRPETLKHVASPLLELWRIPTEEWAGCGELVTSSPWAAFAKDPAAIIAGDETASATLHLTEGRASADQAAWVSAFFEFGIRKCRDRCDEGQNTDED
jgi:hypothetical protein